MKLNYVKKEKDSIKIKINNFREKMNYYFMKYIIKICIILCYILIVDEIFRTKVLWAYSAYWLGIFVLLSWPTICIIALIYREKKNKLLKKYEKKMDKGADLS
jgi:hypothetical protein